MRIAQRRGFQDGASINDAVLLDEIALHEFKDILQKQLGITPEAFFKLCDSQGKKSFNIGDFRKQILETKLVMSQKSVNRLIDAFDENLKGAVTIDEYYDALDAYDCRGDEDDSPSYHDNLQAVSPTRMSVFKMIKALEQKKIDNDGVFKFIDAEKAEFVRLDYLERKLKALGELNPEELKRIRSFFDLDGDGQIDKYEFLWKINRAQRLYAAYLKKIQNNIKI